MNISLLKENPGWVVMGVAVVISAYLVYSIPTGVDLPEIQQDQQTGVSSVRGIGDVPSPIELRPYFSDYLPSGGRSLFELPQRWTQLPPEEPKPAPMPETDRLQLPRAVFWLPIPPRSFPSWSPLPESVRGNDNGPENVSMPDIGELRPNGLKNDQSPGGLSGQYTKFDRIWHPDEEKWLKGHLIDTTATNYVFRELKSGDVVRIAREDSKVVVRSSPEGKFKKRRRKIGDASDIRTYRELVNWAEENGLYEEAASVMEKIIEKSSPGRDKYLRAARLYEFAGKPHEQLRILKEALEHDILTRHRVWLKRGRLEWKLGLRTMAIRSLEKSIEERPLHLEARFQKLLYLGKQHQIDQMKSELEKIEGEISTISNPPRRHGLLNTARILLNWYQGNERRTYKMMRELKIPDSDSIEFQFIWEYAYLFKSRYLLREKEFSQVMSLLEKGISSIPDSHRLWHNLAVLASVLEEQDTARKAFEVAQSLAPNKTVSHIARDVVLDSDGNRSGGFSIQGQGMNDLAGLYYGARKLLYEESDQGAGRTDEARSMFETIHRQYSGFVPGAIGLSHVLIKDGKWTIARAVLREHVPRSWLRNYLLAYTQTRSRNLQQALDILENTPEPRDSRLRAFQKCLKGEVLVRMRNLREAKSILDVPSRFSELSGYANSLLKIVQSSRSRLLFEDDFTRPGGREGDEDLGYGWSENSGSYGIVIRLKNGGAVFEGTQTTEAKFTRMWQESDPKQLRRVKFKGRVERSAESLVIGLAISRDAGNRRRGFLIGISQNGNVRTSQQLWGTDRDRRWRTLQNLKLDSLESGTSFRFSLYRKEVREDDVRWFFNAGGQEEQISGVPIHPGRNQEGKVRISFFTTADDGSEYSVRLERFRLIHQKEE